jgi:hypothetical protein
MLEELVEEDSMVLEATVVKDGLVVVGVVRERRRMKS